MPLTDITNVTSATAKRGVAGWKQTDVHAGRACRPVLPDNPEKQADMPKADEKELLKNALSDLRRRKDALLEQVLPARERRQKLEGSREAALCQAESTAVRLNENVAEHESKLLFLQGKEVKLRGELNASNEDIVPLQKTRSSMRAGVQAKEKDLSRTGKEVERLHAARSAKEKEGESKMHYSSILAKAAFDEVEAAQLRTQFMAQNVPTARRLHNGYSNLKGNIRVFCRFRPKLAGEADGLSNIQYWKDEQHVTLSSELQKSVTGLSSHSRSWEFSFDRVFSPSAGQADIFDEISLLVQSALDGYRVAIFAYGQTGGGKTYTMDGPQVENAAPETRGVIPRTVDLIFQEVSELSHKGWNFSVNCTLLEVYNEGVYDILAPRSAANQRPPTSTDQFVSKQVENASAVHRLLAKAARERHVAATACNDRSSRSHAVFQLSIDGRRAAEGGEQRVSGLLSLVDLAGSERVEKSQVTGERLKEAQCINKSLSALGDVVEALARRGAESSNASCHVPYRNSRLTMLLKESLGGESKALMFVNVSPCQQQLAETLSSLRFASKVHSCNLGVAKRLRVDTKENGKASMEGVCAVGKGGG
eukprot:TRINITY_DN103658_c0_g1_i1.p1 TRINITY_DN103658_c0_g1~~TRINITY_DN103658_c0_g1_i1.p1  ORF type:complete len:593 (-),score=115.83 TRINITY_DN103658_c0_g1_i1:106-1884(-)